MARDGTRLHQSNRRLDTANVAFGDALHPPGAVWAPNFPGRYQLVILHSGSCQVRIDGVSRDFAVGQVCLLRPWRSDACQFTAERETHQSYCAVRRGFLALDLARRLETAEAVALESQAVRLLIEIALKVRSPGSVPAERLLESLAACLFAACGYSVALADPLKGHDLVLHRFLEYVGDHFAEETCLAGAQQQAQVSRNTLIHLLRSEMQLTPARYLWRTRIERGLAMLNETSQTIGEIAYQCGFKNPFHFSRLVKQYAGCSPRQVRERGKTDRQSLSDR